jgi:hypothetical protein
MNDRFDDDREFTIEELTARAYPKHKGIEVCKNEYISIKGRYDAKNSKRN